MFKIRSINLAVPLALSMLLPMAAWAGFFGDHPKYVHAMSDLRTARYMIAQPSAPNVSADENRAVGEIDAALGEIKQAALDDFKDVWNAPAVDARMDRHGRLGEALNLLNRAHDDIAREEDDRRARGLQRRAIMHLDNAIGAVHQAIEDKHFDEAERRHF